MNYKFIKLKLHLFSLYSKVLDFFLVASSEVTTDSGIFVYIRTRIKQVI